MLKEINVFINYYDNIIQVVCYSYSINEYELVYNDNFHFKQNIRFENLHNYLESIFKYIENKIIENKITHVSIILDKFKFYKNKVSIPITFSDKQNYKYILKQYLKPSYYDQVSDKIPLVCTISRIINSTNEEVKLQEIISDEITRHKNVLFYIWVWYINKKEYSKLVIFSKKFPRYKISWLPIEFCINNYINKYINLKKFKKNSRVVIVNFLDKQINTYQYNSEKKILHSARNIQKGFNNIVSNVSVLLKKNKEYAMNIIFQNPKIVEILSDLKTYYDKEDTLYKIHKVIDGELYTHFKEIIKFNDCQNIIFFGRITEVYNVRKTFAKYYSEIEFYFENRKFLRLKYGLFFILIAANDYFFYQLNILNS